VNKIDQYIIWGSAGHAKVLADIILSCGSKIVALFDNNPNAISCIPNVPLYYGLNGLNKWISGKKSLHKTGAVIAIGGSGGKDRLELAQTLGSIGFSTPCIIHKSAAISKSSLLGEGSHILAQSVISADVSIGNQCIINNSSNIDHECRLGNGVHVAPGAILCGCVCINDNTMIGAGSVILPRINIGKNVLVGAGSIVTHDIPDNVIVAGNPAKILNNHRLEVGGFEIPD
jgi:sugar O-acyltransferase (sialic acid O-acetyltransferase NeuD family)